MTECIDTIGFIFKKSNVKIKCYKTGCSRYKLAVFKLSKSDFASSTLAIASSIQDAWDGFRNNINTLINSDFMISVGKCNKLNSFGAKLVKVKKCTCCDDISLYFGYNIVPLTPTNNTNCNGVCIPLVYGSNVPTVSCYYENYWPNPPPESPSDVNNPTCANIAGNFFYNLESTTYYDIKFFHQQNYCQTPCFKSQTVC